MQTTYVLCTDTGADIPWRMVQQQRIEIAHLHYTLNDAAFIYDLGRETDLAAFYYAMRNGSSVETIPVLPETFCALWNPALANGQDVLYISLSSRLSKTFLAAKSAREQMLELYKGRRIVLIDTHCCSIAQGMLVFEAAQMRRENMSLDEVAGWIVENRRYVHGLLLPHSTQTLKEFGLYAGGSLFPKPTVLRLGAEGMLETEAKCKDVEEALYAMAEYVREKGYALKNQVVGITHTDAPELAGQMKDILAAETDCVETAILPMGPITGAYVGPDSIGLAFFGSRR